MTKRIFSALLLVVMLFSCMTAFAALDIKDAEDPALYLKSVSYDEDEEILDITIANKGKYAVNNIAVNFDTKAEVEFETFISAAAAYQNIDQNTTASLIIDGDLEAGGEKNIKLPVKIKGYDASEAPVIDVQLMYIPLTADLDLADKTLTQEEQMAMMMGQSSSYEKIFEATTAKDILNPEETSKTDAIMNFLKQTGFYMTADNLGSIIMILIACVLLYLAIVKQFEPLLLLPIAFGMLLTNLMGAEVFHEELFADGHVHWDLFKATNAVTPGLIDYLYLGVKLGIYPCLIFVGVGAMTDFGPLIANPKSLLLGAAAQIGIFATFIGASMIGFNPQQAGSIGIIGGADGPTAIFLTSKLAPELLGPIAVAAYSYMALVPVIQPPIMKLLTSKKERQITMKELRPVSKTEKIIFPIVVTIFVALLVPSAAPLVGCLMLGNLLKESGVCERLSKTVQNELMNIVTIFLGISVGATATASTFLSLDTIKIIVMGVVAFGVATACGLLLAKFMNLFLKEKINPLIGSAGVSAVPMAARVSQKVGQEENPSNFLLMHAMGPNVAGVIGSAIAAGALLAMLG